MARPRKNVSVARLLAQANALLSAPDSPYTCAEFRRGVACILESSLHDTGNYAGYNFLAWINGGHDRWIADGKPSDTTPYLGDQTRRVYFPMGRTAPLARGVSADVSADYPLAIGRAS